MYELDDAEFTERALWVAAFIDRTGELPRERGRGMERLHAVWLSDAVHRGRKEQLSGVRQAVLDQALPDWAVPSRPRLRSEALTPRAEERVERLLRPPAA